MKPRPEPSRSWAANTLLMAASLILVFIAMEAAAVYYLHNMASFRQFFRYASARQMDASAYQRFGLRYSPHQYLGYYPTPNLRQVHNGFVTNRHNALGFRGEEISETKPEGEFRIVCLGGSTTYTNQVYNYRRTYPAQLQKVLHERGYDQVRVINAGAEGYTSWESLVNLQFRVLDLDPDLIIVYHGINDALARLIYPFEAYRPDNSGFRAPGTSLATMPPIWEYSTVIRILLINMGWTESHNNIARVKKFTEHSRHREMQMQWSRKRYPSGVFEEASVHQILDRNPPHYFRANLLSMIGCSQAHGIKVVLGTFAYSPEFTKVALFATPEGQRSLAEGNEVVRALADQPGAHVFDFAAVFPKDADLFTDGQHVNEKGARLKAELFAEYLVDNDLVPGEMIAER